MDSPLILSLLLLLGQYLTKEVTGKEDPVFQLGMENLQNYEVNANQIYKWWLNYKAKTYDYPRTFPICFDLKQPLPDKVKAFKKAFEDLKDLRVYDPKLYSWSLAKDTDNRFLVMDFSRIQVNSSNLKPGENAHTLEQWVNIEIGFYELKPAGLYVQSIAGPLGIPSGEFVNLFRCNDKRGQTSIPPFMDPPDYEKLTHVVPCHYAPRSTNTWPNVFVYDGQPLQKSVSFKYRWSEEHCLETAFFQFLIIATVDYAKFHTILSPIFKYELDSLGGAPSSWDPHYDMIQCGSFKRSDPYTKRITIIQSDTKRIVPNKQYDDCVLYGTEKVTLSTNSTCPPGPFTCSKYWSSKDEWMGITRDWYKKMVDEPEDICCELGKIKGPPPKGSQPPPPPPSPSANSTNSSLNHEETTEEDEGVTTPVPTTTQRSIKAIQETVLKNATERYEKEVKITHGDLCTLVWLVAVPVANLISRFLKEFSNIGEIGLGFWIVAHSALHSLGLVVVWWSLGLVIGTGEDKLGNVSGTHLFLGFIILILQHAQFVTGLERPGDEQNAFWYILSHSICGYISQVFSYLIVFLSDASSARKGTVGALLVIWLLSGVALHFLEIRQDKLLGVILHRAQCPILQRITLTEGKPPLANVKIAVLIFMALSTMGLYGCVVFLHSEEGNARDDK